MRFVPFVFLLPFVLLFQVSASPPVPYTGKISIRGANYFGEAQFRFSLHNGQGTTYWQNGEGAEDTIEVPIRNGRYHVLLGGQGMTPLPPELFLDHEELYLRVELELEEGEGFEHLAPDQVITATPRALVAEWAKIAKVSERVSPGAITRTMLSPEVLADLNQTVADTEPSPPSSPAASSITREMLAPDLRNDLNRTISKQMLGQDVLSELNRTVTHSDLSPQIKADLNRTITYTDLAPQIKADLNRTITASNLAPNTITTAQLNEQILKYLKPEVTIVPQAPGLVFNNQTVTLLSRAEGKYLSYQWYKNGQPIAGATTDRYVIQDLNKTQHDGNYSLVVSNDFGTVTTPTTTIDVNSTPTTHTVLSANNLEMIFCPPGTFMMGSPTTEAGRGADETQHQVTLTNGFYLGKYEVTQAQYETVMTGNSEGLNAKPSNWPNNNDRPVEKVSWNDVQVFLSRLNDMEETAGRLPAGWKYTLPTEAQWEYACRAGTTTRFSWGDDINFSLANYGGNIGQTVNVGQYGANPWGFFDMHGNVYEWVYDWHAAYTSGSQVNPEGPSLTSNRIARGGGFQWGVISLRSSLRGTTLPSGIWRDTGFRLAFQALPADTANPEIILTGSEYHSHSQGIPFVDPGYEAHDARDGNITDQVVVTGTIDENSTGTYLLTYTVEDAAGNTATTVTRTVTVTGNRTVELNATVDLDMIWVQSGTFTMGSPTTESDRGTDETEHNVTITQGFYLGKYEVTQAQYEAVISSNPSEFNATGNGNRPVEDLNWTEALAFCEQLTIRERNAGRIPADWAYVLPTESQWEYACRAGTTTVYSWGNDINATHANWNHGSDANQTEEVGQYAANPWGFFDMHGNVWEWTADWFAAVYPSDNPTIDPTGPASGSYRVKRGGSWYDGGAFLRSARRNTNTPSNRSSRLGFRVGFQKQ
jgi:formylglycine-generating enzyme required for sulfatase activity